MAATSSKPSTKRLRRLNVPLAEWIVSALGLLIVAATLAIIIHEAMVGDRSPPDIEVAVETIVPVRNGFLVKFIATNKGGETASEVLIKGTVAGGRQPDESEAVLDFLPPRSERRGGLFFESDPRSAQLEIRAAGYREP